MQKSAPQPPANRPPNSIPYFGVTDHKPGPNGGMLVKAVDKSGSAGKAGLVPGDEIIALNGKKVEKGSNEQVDQIVRGAGVGATINARVMRSNKPVDLQVKVCAKPPMTLDLEEVVVDSVLERKIAP